MLTGSLILGILGSIGTFFLAIGALLLGGLFGLADPGGWLAGVVSLLGWLALLGSIASLVGAILMGVSALPCIVLTVGGLFLFAFTTLPLLIAALLGFLGRGEAAQTQTPPTYTS